MNSKMKISANVCMAIIAIFFTSYAAGKTVGDEWDLLFNGKDFTGAKNCQI